MSKLCRIGLHKRRRIFFLNGCQTECDECGKVLGFERHGAGFVASCHPFLKKDSV